MKGLLPGVNYYYGPGNVAQWGSPNPEDYLYDRVSRVVKGTLGGGESQSYTFDAFGNMTRMTTDRGSGAQARTISVSPQTNRLNGPGVSYDGAGNLTAFPPHTYTWDPFNMMQSMQGGGNDAFHVYTADDERFCTLDLADPLNLFTYRLRGLDGQVVREFSLSFKRPTPWLWEKDWVSLDMC